MAKKIAIITGASSGLGREFVRLLDADSEGAGAGEFHLDALWPVNFIWMRSGSSRGGKSALKSSRQGSGQILTLLRSILQTKHPLRSCRKSFPQSGRTCAC